MSTSWDLSLPITAGGGAGFPILNKTGPSFPSDADHTATQAELKAITHRVVSGVNLTAKRKLIYPLVDGLIFLVINGTSGSPAQTFTVIGSTGTGVDIAPAAAAWVYCDGTNWSPGSSSSGGGATPQLLIASATLVRPSNGLIDVSADMLQTPANIVATAWATPTVGDKIKLRDAAFGLASKTLGFAGNGTDKVQAPRVQVFSIVGSSYAFREVGECNEFTWLTTSRGSAWIGTASS